MSKRVHTTASSRLKQDYLRIRKDPVPYVTAAPLPSNILEWYVFHFWKTIKT
jgi:ubiquitin-conjugating enzyme E2 J2